jgi:hypothetical protein
MPYPIDAVAISTYDNMLKNKWDSKANLLPTVTHRRNVKGTQTTFNNANAIEVTDTTPGNFIRLVQRAKSRVICTLYSKTAKDIIYKDDADISGIENLLPSSTDAILTALGKYINGQIIGALKDGAQTIVGTTGTKVTLATIIDVNRQMTKKNVPQDGERYWVLYVDQQADMLEIDQVTSADYATMKALMTGTFNDYMGFKFITMGDVKNGSASDAENIGLPVINSGADVLGFAYHKQAVGFASAPAGEITLKVSVEALLEYSTVVQGFIRTGAVAIDPDGIIGVQSAKR